MSRVRRRAILVVAALVIAACSRSSTPRERPPSAAAEHARVRAMLYEDGLIEDREVQAKMSEFVLRMRRDGLEPAHGYQEFRLWLERWAREHPERAGTARARRGPALDGAG